MNPGIFYLYEYDNMQKLRNVGFLKLTRYYHSCTLQLNARGIAVTYSDTLKLCAFYLENDTVGATVLAEVPCKNHMVSARLNFAECQFPDGHTLNTMDGFFLPLSNGRILAAAVPGILVDPKKLLSVFADPHAAKTPSENTERKGSPVPDVEDEKPEHEESVPLAQDAAPYAEEAAPQIQESSSSAEELPTGTPDDIPEEPDHDEMPSDGHTSIRSEDDSLPSIIDAGPGQEDIALSTECTATDDDATPAGTDCTVSDGDPAPAGTDCTASDGDPAPAGTDCTASDGDPAPAGTDCTDISLDDRDPETAPDTPKETVRKIQRSDMSVLPRCYWYLANNSFLLHGYHNYSHLLLVEKDGRYWIGVPGIYDAREARAARLFGFPQFTDSYNDQLQLSDDEKDSQGIFGYWCCYLK